MASYTNVSVSNPLDALMHLEYSAPLQVPFLIPQ